MTQNTAVKSNVAPKSGKEGQFEDRGKPAAIRSSNIVAAKGLFSVIYS